MYTAMLIWFGPGKRRATVSPVRNCSLDIQRRCSTTIRWLQADRPPPKAESATWSIPQNNSGRLGRRSVMDEVGIWWQFAVLVQAGIKGIWSVIFLCRIPISLEGAAQPLHHLGSI